MVCKISVIVNDADLPCYSGNDIRLTVGAEEMGLPKPFYGTCGFGPCAIYWQHFPPPPGRVA